MSKNREVNINLYKILDDNEVHASMIYGIHKEAQLTALIDFSDLKELANILGCSYFDDGGVEVTMMDGYIAIRVDEIITEWFEHEIESYREVIGEHEYIQYLEYKKMEN